MINKIKKFFSLKKEKIIKEKKLKEEKLNNEIKNNKYIFQIVDLLDDLYNKGQLDIDYILKLMNENKWGKGERIHFIRKYCNLVKK